MSAGVGVKLAEESLHLPAAEPFTLHLLAQLSGLPFQARGWCR